MRLTRGIDNMSSFQRFFHQPFSNESFVRVVRQKYMSADVNARANASIAARSFLMSPMFAALIIN